MKRIVRLDMAIRGAVESAISMSKRPRPTPWEDYADAMSGKFRHWDSVDIPALPLRQRRIRRPSETVQEKLRSLTN